MSFDPVWLTFNILVSSCGYALYRYGKQRTRAPILIGGVILMVAPYFFQDVKAMLGFSLGIVATMYVLRRAI